MGFLPPVSTGSVITTRHSGPITKAPRLRVRHKLPLTTISMATGLKNKDATRCITGGVPYVYLYQLRNQ